MSTPPEDHPPCCQPRGLAAVMAPPAATPEEQDRLAGVVVGMRPLALRLAGDVREGDPVRVGKLLDKVDELDRDEMHGLLLLLAGMHPVDVEPPKLLAWLTWDEHGRQLVEPRSGEGPYRYAARAGVSRAEAAAVYQHYRRRHGLRPLRAAG